MDPNLLASKLVCQKCKILPKRPFLSEDGFFYCEECAGEIGRRVRSNDIESPGISKHPGKVLILALTVESLNKKLVATGAVDRKYLGDSDTERPDNVSEWVLEVKKNAEKGSSTHMAMLGRWYLFGEQEGVECNAKEGYKWVNEAAEKDDVDGMAYKGICLIHGFGVDKDRNEGFDLLVDAANQGSGTSVYFSSDWIIYLFLYS